MILVREWMSDWLHRSIDWILGHQPACIPHQILECWTHLIGSPRACRGDELYSEDRSLRLTQERFSGRDVSQLNGIVKRIPGMDDNRSLYLKWWRWSWSGHEEANRWIYRSVLIYLPLQFYSMVLKGSTSGTRKEEKMEKQLVNLDVLCHPLVKFEFLFGIANLNVIIL